MKKLFASLALAAAVAPVWAATQTVTLAVPGMTCAACPIRGLTLSGTKTHVKQRFLPLTPLLMVSDDLWSPVLPA